MKWTVAVTMLVLTLLLAAPATRTAACGYHDPLVLAQGMLNHAYPNALHVTGSVWTAQKAGTLAMPDRERLMARGAARKALDQKAFENDVVAVHSFGLAMEAAGTPMANGTKVAVVLIEPMLWTRFIPVEERIGVSTHLTAPEKGDLVVITDSPVLRAIEKGTMTVAKAHQTGCLRVYGRPAQETAFLDAYGTLGASPLPAVKDRALVLSTQNQNATASATHGHP